VTVHWNRLPREALEPPFLQILKSAAGQNPEQPVVVDPVLSSGAGLDDL